MSDNNEPNKQIEKEKENKDGEESEESEETEENEENENEDEVVEREVIDFTKLSRTIEDYYLPPRKAKPKFTRKLYGDEWQYPDNESDESGDSDINPLFNLGDKIKTFKFEKLKKVKPYKGRKRIYEESEVEDYADSVEEGDSEYDLENVILDVDCDNENTINQKEKDWLDECNNNYKWDEDKKEFNSNGKRVKNDFVGFSQEQILRVEARKNKEHNLKKKHLLAIFMNFDPILFDVDDNYENEWIKIYNKEKVIQRYTE
jgi:hypothetical protein